MKMALAHFIENYGSPFFVGSLVTQKILFVSKKAEELFGCTTETCDIEKIFDKTNDRIKEIIGRTVKENSATLIYNFTAITSTGEKILVDLQTGFFNEEKTQIFLEVIPQQDTRMEMAMHQVSQSLKPEAILNFDDELSIVHCNAPFHEVFDSSEELRQTHFENQLINGFLPEIRDSLVVEIKEALTIGRVFSKKIKVFTPAGEEYWYQMELERRTLDNSGKDKIIAYMTNIERQVEMEKDYSSLKENLALLQELTENILYRVDVKTRVLSHNFPKLQHRIGNDISNYAQIFLNEKIIHPEDEETYLTYLKNFYSGTNDVEDCVLRFALVSDEYQWYKIDGKKIFNKQGEFVEVLGALINVDKEYKLREAFERTNKYFKTLEKISNESFFHVDVKRKILYQQGEVAQELGFDGEVYDYPESVLYKVFPEDLEKYKKFTYDSLNGVAGKTEVRVMNVKGEFFWYEILCDVVLDDDGNAIEVIGRMNNIHDKKNIEKEYSNTNQYFNAIQSMTGESFYTVDVKKRILRQQGAVAEQLGLAAEIYNFPESCEYKIYPEDLEKYRTFIQNSMTGSSGRLEVRVKSPTGNFEWYEIIAKPIHDNNGEVTDFVGIMKNINNTITVEGD